MSDDGIEVCEEKLRQYRKEGYCLLKGLIPIESVDAMRRRVDEIVDRIPDWSERHFQVLDPDRYRSARGEALPGGIQQPAEKEEVFRTVAGHPKLEAAMSWLLGGPVERFTDQIGVKHGMIREEQGGRSYFHQDSFYWHIDPRLGCNCWIPMSRVDSECIALAVMPGSHRGWSLAKHESYYDDPPIGHMRDRFEPFKRHRIPSEQVDPSEELLIPMDPGDGLFFTNYTWHRSEPNRSGETHAFYAIAYQIAPKS